MVHYCVGGILIALQVMRAAEIVVKAPLVWIGIWDALDAFSPYNVFHYAVMALFLSPAFGAFWFRAP